MKRNKSAWKLEKETVELWNKEAKERYKGHAELSDLLDRKAITENARDEAIINQSSATMSRLAINS